MIKERSQLVLAAVGATDLAVTAGAWVLSYHIRFGLFPAPKGVPALPSTLDAMVIAMLLTIIFFTQMGLYRPRRIQSLWMEAFDLLRACVAVWIAEVVISHFVHRPRLSLGLQVTFLALWPVLLVIVHAGGRALLRRVRRRGRNVRSAAIIGTGRLGQKLLQSLRRERWTGYQCLYLVEDHRIGQEFLGLPVFGPVSEIHNILEREPVDTVFVALPRDRSDELAEVLNKLSASVADVNVVPDLLSYHFLQHQVTQLGNLPIVNLTHSPQSGWNAAAKRLFDVVVASAALVVTAPLMLLIAVLVKCTSKGPVFYVQRRASIGDEEFDIIKFRSMYVDDTSDRDAEWGTPPGDPRVTRFGRVLRTLSLDELPQLINVLKGDMSLVGPRPERPEFIERFRHQVPRYMLRHHVKAGLTGWAQVHGYRGRTSLTKRIQYDLDYISRWSLSFDLWILVLTVFGGLLNRRE